VVLTIDSRAYDRIGHGAGNEPPDSLEVRRALGFDAARQLSVFGRYPRMLALPDRWATWKWWAVPAAMRAIREHNIAAVWSTFPIASAHAIGMEVARRAGLPWIAEFRDPMWQGDYPSDPKVNEAWRSLEASTFASASAVVVTTPGTREVYRRRFPLFCGERLRLIENGYDEETFVRAGDVTANPLAGPRDAGPVTMLHSGVVYRSERDPTQFFGALAALKERRVISAASLRVVLRASGDEQAYQRDLVRLGIADIVRLEPAIPYLDALQEMLTVDALLVLQASNCNAQVPAKLFEYLRAARPILALTDPAGDTARTLEAAGTGLVARLDDQGEIEAAVLEFVEQVRHGTWRRARPEAIVRYSRQSQTATLAGLLDELATGKSRTS
jgi:glycosyltransferase involved in cell wall biosynthesis